MDGATAMTAGGESKPRYEEPQEDLRHLISSAVRSARDYDRAREQRSFHLKLIFSIVFVVILLSFVWDSLQEYSLLLYSIDKYKHDGEW